MSVARGLALVATDLPQRSHRNMDTDANESLRALATYVQCLATDTVPPVYLAPDRFVTVDVTPEFRTFQNWR